MVAGQSPGPESPRLALSHAEVSAYLEREFRLLKRAARGLSPHCPHTADDIFSVMVIAYINRGVTLRTFDPRKSYNGLLWNYIANFVIAAARRVMKAEQRRGMTIGKGRVPKGWRLPKFSPPECLESVTARNSR